MISSLLRFVALLCVATPLLRSADTVELLPGKIIGSVAVSGDTVVQGSVQFSATDGSGASASASFSGSTYSVIVPAGRTWRASVLAYLGSSSGTSSYLRVNLNDSVSVAASQTVTYDVTLNAARVNVLVNVANGTLDSITRLQASGSNGSTSYDSYSQDQGFITVVPGASMSIYGAARVTSAANQSSTKSLSTQYFSSVEPGATVTWNVDAAFSAGTLTGSYSFPGANPVSAVYTYAYDVNYNFLGALSTTPFEFTNLPAGVVHLYTQVSFADGASLSQQRDIEVVAGEVANITFGGTQSSVITPVVFSGFLTAANVSGGQLWGNTNSQPYTSSNSSFDPTKGFTNTLIAGDWNLGQWMFTATDSSIPGNYFYTQLSYYDGSAQPLAVAAGTSVTRAPVTIETTQTEFTFDVLEPAGAGAETQITYPYITGSMIRYSPDGQYLGQSSVYSVNYGSAQAKPRVRLIGPPGTYQLNAYGNVDGSQVSFGQFTITLQEARQTPTGANVAIGAGVGVALVFEQVTAPGVTTASQLPVGPALPAGYTGLTSNGSNVFYNVSTSATVTGDVAVAISYDDASVTEAEEANLRLFYYDAAAQSWIDVTEAVDPATNTISGIAPGVSLFAVALSQQPADTTPPVITAPAGLFAEATGASGAVVNFSASAVDLVDGAVAVSASVPSGSTFPLGVTKVTLTATDAAGNTSSTWFSVTVVDTTAPVLGSVTASPGTIWSPNKKMVPVVISAPATDATGATVKIVSVTTNEPDGTTQWEITGDLTLNVKADRKGGGSGRVYTITVEAKDAAGNTTRSTVTVTVPHDQRK